MLLKAQGCKTTVFLSTPSARRATPGLRDLAEVVFYFYPRPPRGGRQRGPADWGRLVSISIHALREEGDTVRPVLVYLCAYFYPRPPRGGRPTTAAWRSPITNFYPRPPRGGRRTASSLAP